MIWTFGAGPKVFIYESAVLVVGYSYGYFTNRDMLKVGAILSVVTALDPAAAGAALLAADRDRPLVPARDTADREDDAGR